jgi:hypothetical protein
VTPTNLMQQGTYHFEIAVGLISHEVVVAAASHRYTAILGAAVASDYVP